MRVLSEQWLAAELETQTSFHSFLLEHLDYLMGFKGKKIKIQLREGEKKKPKLEAKSAAYISK